MSLVLHEFISLNREEILARCRAKVAMRSSPPSSTASIDHGVPMFLDELVVELRLGPSLDRDITRTASQNGQDLLRRGFTVSQVVHGYGDVCQAITELAMDLKASISTDDFHGLNRCLDEAIAGAVTQYEYDQCLNDTSADERDLETLAQALRNAIHNASVAFEMITSGRVGFAGRTGTTVRQSLMSSTHLADRLIDTVRSRPFTDASSKVG